MAKRRKQLQPGEVEGVRTRIEHWRRTRVKRTAMPEELWSEAASLARVHGIYRISRALGVSYESLRRRVEQGTMRGSGSGRRQGGFVELSTTELVQASPAAGTVVELSRADGTKLMVQLPDGEGLDVLGLAKVLCGRRS